MIFANPWGLLALLALPVIAGIHLFHRRFPPLVVGGTHLWGLPRETPIAGRKQERLPISLTLLLELLAALLIALLLSQPRLGDWGTAKHLIIVLDHSASMQAQPAGELSFRDAVVNLARERIADLNRGSRVTVIRSGHRPVTLAGPAARPQQALDVLDDWQPTAASHDAQTAWDLAAQFAGDSGEVLFLTDRMPAEDRPLPRQMSVVAVGQPLPNVLLTSARRKRGIGDEAGSVYVRLVNYSGESTAAIVKGSLTTDDGKPGAVVFQSPVTLPPGGEVPRLFPLANDVGEIVVEVSTATDGLALDNRATLPVPGERTVKYALELPADDPSTKQIKRVFSVLPDLVITTRERANLVLSTPTPLPSSDRELWWLGIGPLSRTEAAREATTDLTGPYILEKNHPLVDGLSLGQLIWRGAQPLTLDAAPLIACDRLPLLVQLNGTKTTAFILNADLEPAANSSTGRSQLADSENWPILLSNLVELRREDLPGLRRANYRVGETVRFRWNDAESLQLVPIEPSPTLTERPLAQDNRGVVAISGLDEPAVYNVLQGEEVIGRFAVNFEDRRESVLTALNSGEREAAATADTTFLPDNTYTWPILIVTAVLLGLLLLNWTTALRN